MRQKLKQLFRFSGDFQNKEDIILRDYLSLERTKLANERTMLAYLRTSLYLLIGGIALLGFKDFKDLHFLGYTALGLSFILLLVGIFRYFQLKRHLRKIYVPFDNDEDDEEEV